MSTYSAHVISPNTLQSNLLLRDVQTYLISSANFRTWPAMSSREDKSRRYSPIYWDREKDSRMARSQRTPDYDRRRRNSPPGIRSPRGTWPSQASQRDRSRRRTWNRERSPSPRRYRKDSRDNRERVSRKEEFYRDNYNHRLDSSDCAFDNTLAPCFSGTVRNDEKNTENRQNSFMEYGFPEDNDFQDYSFNEDFNSRRDTPCYRETPAETVSKSFYNDRSEGELTNSDCEFGAESAVHVNTHSKHTNYADTLMEGWKIVSETVPSERIVAFSSDKAKVSINVPGTSRPEKEMKKVVPTLVENAFAAVSDSLQSQSVDLLNVKSLDCNAPCYRPDNPSWKPFSNKTMGNLPLGLKVPQQWDINLNHSKLTDLENLTASMLHVASYTDLLVESQGMIMNRDQITSEDISSLMSIHESLAVAASDMVTLNCALATDFTLLRRDRVLKERTHLDIRTKHDIRNSAVIPDQLFGPEAENALKAQDQNPAQIIKHAVLELNKSNRRDKHSNPSKFQSVWKAGKEKFHKRNRFTPKDSARQRNDRASRSGNFRPAGGKKPAARDNTPGKGQ